jgi:hypothetical protein
MSLSTIVDLARQDLPPVRRTPLPPDAIRAAERVRASEGRVLVTASLLSAAAAVAVACTAYLSEPPPADPLESFLVAVDGGMP